MESQQRKIEQRLTHFNRPDFVDAPLYVIAVVFNPQRYKRRWELYKIFERYVLDTNEAHLYTVECTFGERSKVYTEQITDKHTVIHVQTTSELWIKENLINIGIQHLPEDWKYVAWVDADIQFARHDWAGETIQQLQHYDFVQMFSHCQDLDSNSVPINGRMFDGFMYSYINNISFTGVPPTPETVGLKKINTLYGAQTGKIWHPGFAWAARKEAINKVGGLIDFAVTGAADRHMAHALVGDASGSIEEVTNEEYRKMVLRWGDNCDRYIKRNVGFVPGLVNHFFHGNIQNRRYYDRWKILRENDYNPFTDIKKDWQGLYQLTTEKPNLRDGLRGYFRQRNEDQLSD